MGAPQTERSPELGSHLEEGEAGLAARGLPVPVWRALARAAALTCEQCARPVPGAAEGDLRAELSLVLDALWEAAGGAEPTLELTSPGVPLRQLLATLRRAFLVEATVMKDADHAAAALRVLQALSELEQSADSGPHDHVVPGRSASDALELIVEVAHDMRSPLGSILLLVGTLRKGRSGPINSIQERQLGLVYSAAFGLSSLTSDLIELAHSVDRLGDLHPIPFSVSEVMHSVHEIVRPIAEEKGLLVRLTMPEADLRVGQPGLLNRVLLNLITNALKSTDTGFVDVSGKQLSRTRVEFSVSDTGPGIPPEVMTTLFEAFQRHQAGQYTFSSSGLGLSICRKLVSAMNSVLKVETDPDRGTRFYFELELPLASRLPDA